MCKVGFPHTVLYEQNCGLIPCPRPFAMQWLLLRRLPPPPNLLLVVFSCCASSYQVVSGVVVWSRDMHTCIHKLAAGHLVAWLLNPSTTTKRKEMTAGVFHVGPHSINTYSKTKIREIRRRFFFLFVCLAHQEQTHATNWPQVLCHIP